MNFMATLKNNWKKITFGTAVLGYGAYSAKTHYDITSHMRLVCQEVAETGMKNGSVPKRVVVVLNPVANKKKSEKTFKKYCEPILHLAGYSVEVLKTNYVGHAKTLIENLTVLPDAIVVAGGDGTSSEVVTGLLRRDEPPCPLVLLPLGCKNETALRFAQLEPKNKVEHVKSLSNIIMPMIHEKCRFENVIKFDVVGSSTETNLKPIYGLNKFSWGLLRDIESVKDKYWYFGNLRHYAAALLNSFSNSLNWNVKTHFVYTPPCPGCRNCHVQKERKVTKSFFSKFVPTKPITEGTNRPQILNEDCVTEIQGDIETNQLNIACSRNTDDFYELETKCITTLTPGLDFIKNIKDVAKDSIEPSVVLKSRTIQLVPETAAGTSYSIDGEEYDARPVKVSIVPNAIKVFA